MRTTPSFRSTVVTAIIIGMSAMWLGQGVASAVVRFARNSHKVDGFHAVGADASRTGRAGRLVATDAEGLLPSGIVASVGHADDADKLGGRPSSEFTARCVGMKAWAIVPADVPTEDRYFTASELNVPSHNCLSQLGLTVSVKHLAQGVYRVLFDGLVVGPEGLPPRVAVLVTPEGIGRLTSYEVVADPSLNGCPAEGMDAPLCPRDYAVEVTLRDGTGTPIDAEFTAALL